MADFIVWGRIEPIGALGYFVIVSELPRNFPRNASDTAVETGTVDSREEAVALRDGLMQRAGEKIRARGDRVVDVEEDGV